MERLGLPHDRGAGEGGAGAGDDPEGFIVALASPTQGCLIPVPGKFCPGQTDEEYRTEFSLWSIANSALLVATDVRNLTDLQKEVRLCVCVCGCVCVCVCVCV